MAMMGSLGAATSMQYDAMRPPIPSTLAATTRIPSLGNAPGEQPQRQASLPLDQAIQDEELIWSDRMDNDEDIETVLESCLKELATATENMSSWRARVYLILSAGPIIPLKLMDIDLLTSAYLSLSPAEHVRFHTMNMKAPLSVAKLIVLSKLLNAFFVAVLLASMVLLCVETDPFLAISNFSGLFIAECVLACVFLAEIVLQVLCIRWGSSRTSSDRREEKLWRRARTLWRLFHAILLSDQKIQRITTGESAAPSAFNVFQRAKADEEEVINNAPSETYRKRFEHLDNEDVKRRWLLLDVVATAPFFLEILVCFIEVAWKRGNYNDFLFNMYSWNGVDVVRFLRLVRILRLLKLGQKSERLRIIWKAILKSAEGIWLLLLTLPFFVSFFSFILFFAELGNGKIVDGIWYNSLGEKSPIQSMADCFWVVMETTTTVGYGDIVPQTWPGRAVASIVMFLSLFIIAFPLCMITMQYTHYARLFSLQKRANKEAAKMLRERLLATSDEHIAFHAPILPTQSVNSPKVDEHATSDTDTVSTAVHFKLKNSKPLPERSTSALGLATKSMFSGESIFKLRSKSSTNLLNLTPNLVPKSADGVVTSPVDDNGNMSGQDSQPSTPTILASKSIDPELSPPMQLPVSISWSAPPLLHRSDSWTKSRVKPELVTETPLASSPRRSSTSATAGGFKQIANASRELERPMSPMQIMPYRPSSANSRFNIREVERQVDMENLPDGYPDVVLFKVQDWKLEYRADRREDVLVMRVRCKDEDRYRRLMGVLAGFC